MANQALYINGQWLSGEATVFQSINSVDKTVVWEGAAASEQQVDDAVKAARSSANRWAASSYEDRERVVTRFGELLGEQAEHISKTIAEETGKPLWEARTEAAAMKGKIAISIKAFHERTGTVENAMPVGKAFVRHKPHGVVAVFGSYNFPGHLPNGHIVPALLAGNTVVFKPSELTPAVAELSVKLWEQAGIPKGVINLVQGEKETGIHLASHPNLDGLFFTGSSNTGKLIHKQYGGQPGKILALEMGGNNPLIVEAMDDVKAVVHDTIHSAFITAGQRCTCARRLFVPESEWGDEFLRQLVSATESLKVGRWDDEAQPFMGALISEVAANNILDAQAHLQSIGGKSLIEATPIKPETGLLSPGIIDVSAVKSLPDEEYFGPLLQVIRYKHLEEAIDQANNTRFGLSAGLLSASQASYDLFFNRIRAGIVNWNRPITGASGAAPFGGPGDSGNHRPSAYFAADYCSFPVASVESETLVIPENLAPGLTL